MDFDGLPNDFAYLSTDIIVDVVKTEAPPVRDLAGFATLTGNWADIVKSDDVFETDYEDGHYRKFHIDDNGCHVDHTFQSPPPGNYRLENVSFAPQRESSKVWSLLNECMGKVCLEFECGFYDDDDFSMMKVTAQEFENSNRALKLLLERPITQLILDECKSLYKFYRSELKGPACGNVILESFKSLIMKPKLQSLTIYFSRVLDEEVEQYLFEFVKKPNFLLLKAPLSSAFLPKLLDYWLTLTTFPNYVRTVEYYCSSDSKTPKDFEELYFHLEKAGECVEAYRGETYFRKHPNNQHRGIEISTESSYVSESSQIKSVRLV